MYSYLYKLYYLNYIVMLLDIITIIMQVSMEKMCKTSFTNAIFHDLKIITGISDG